MPVELKINNVVKSVDVEPDTPLLWVLRDTLNLHGTKYGCGIGLCGACTVMVAGQAVRSCLTRFPALPASRLLRSRVSLRMGLTRCRWLGKRSMCRSADIARRGRSCPRALCWLGRLIRRTQRSMPP